MGHPRSRLYLPVYAGSGSLWRPRYPYGSSLLVPSSAIAAASSLIVMSSGVSYEAQKLYTAQDMTWNDDSGLNSVAWRTDEAEPYARITYNVAWTSGLRYTFVNRTSKQFYVSYWIRRFSANASKQFKVQGIRYNSGATYSNSTFGPTAGGYTGNEYELYYGDAASGGNDNTTLFHLDGTPTGDSVYTRSAPTFIYCPAKVYQDITGTLWERYELYGKYNDDDIANGEYGIAKNGVRVYQQSNTWNTPNGAQYRDICGLAEYSAQSGFYEDYKKFDVSTSYRPTWMSNGLTSLFSGLRAGIDLTVDDNTSGVNTITWTSDQTGAFARIAYNTSGTIRLLWPYVDRTKTSGFVEFSSRFSATGKNAKHFKVFGQVVSGAYSNTTFSANAGVIAEVLYDDSINGGDIGTETNYLGQLTGGGARTRAAPTFRVVTNLVNDTNWHRWSIYFKFNDDGVANGEYAVWCDGVLVLWMTGVFNCGTGLQKRDFLTWGDNSPASGWTLDIKNVDIYDGRPLGRGI